MTRGWGAFVVGMGVLLVGGLMAFVPESRRSRPRGPYAGGRVWAVGSHAYVHCPSPHPAIVLTDEFERGGSASLDDGAEVEVRAWRPRAAAGARYHVRALDGAGEGWLGVAQLRSTREAQPPPATRSSTPSGPETADPSTRRFGRR